MADERPISRISVNCFRVWARFDAKGLAEWVRTHKLVVRVPVERQKRPEPTLG